MTGRFPRAVRPAGWACAVASALALVPLACQPPAAPPAPKPGEPATSPAAVAAATAPATLPAEARLSLSELTPKLDKPTDAADADKLSERAAEIVAEAEKLVAQKEYTRALALLDRARGFDPVSARIQRGLGLAYGELGDRAKAEPALRASLASAPDHVRVNLLVGTYAAMRRQDAQALLDLRRALLCGDATDDNPDTGEALLRLSSLLDQKGYLTAALEGYRRLSELVSAHGRAYAQRPLLRALVTSPEKLMVAQGIALMGLGKVEEAALALEQAYRRDKAHPDAGRLAVKALLRKGDLERAGAIVMELLQDQHPSAMESAEEWALARKDPKAPRKLLDAYLARGGKDAALVIAMAEAAAKLGGTDEAAAILKQNLAAAPDSAGIGLRLARLYARTGQLETSARQLSALLTGDSPDVGQIQREARDLARRGAKQETIDALAASSGKAEGKARPSLLCVAAMLAAARQDAAAAQALLGQAIAADAQFWPAYEVLADIHLAGGDFAPVDKLAADVSRAGGESYFWFYLVGKAQLARGRATDALTSLEQARARNGRHVPTLLLLGQACLQARKLPDAERALLSALALAGDDPSANRRLFELYAMQNRRQEASQVVARFLQAYPTSVSGRVLLGRYYLLEGQTERARSLAAQVLAEAPDDVDVRGLDLQLELPDNFAQAPLPAAKVKAVTDKIQAVLRLDADNLEARVTHAALLANQGKYAEAADALEALHRREPANLRLTAAYLDALVKAKQEDRLVKAVEAVAREKELSPATRMVLLEELVKIKRYPQAEVLLDKWLPELSKTPEARQELELLRYRALQVYEAGEHYDKAQALLDEWISAGPEEAAKAIARAQKLRLYGKAKQFDQAVAYATKWSQNEPGNERPKLLLIGVLIDGKQYESAGKLIDEWLTKETDVDLVHDLTLTKIDLLAEQNKVDDALKQARQWLQAKQAQPPSAKRDEHVAEIQRRIIRVLILAERKKDALDQAEALVAANPKDPGVLRLKVLALQVLEREDEALPVLQKIYELTPDEPGINNDLGYTWADRGINLDKAEAMIRKALAADKDSVPVRDSFGWVLYKQGKFTEAWNVFEDIAAQDAPVQHAVILDHAGDVAWRSGLKDRAVALWERAVEAANKTQRKEAEDKKVLAQTPRKLEAVRKRQAPKLAPLGQGVPEPK